MKKQQHHRRSAYLLVGLAVLVVLTALFLWRTFVLKHEKAQTFLLDDNCQSGVMLVCFDSYLLSLSGETAEGLSEVLREEGPACHGLAIEDEALYLSISGEEQAAWIRFFQEEMEALSRHFITLGGRIDWSETMDEVMISCRPDLAFGELMTAISRAEYCCGAVQLISRRKDWLVEVEIINLDTGRLVSRGSNKEGVFMTTEDWIASYD